MAKKYKTELHSAWIVGKINADEIEKLAEAGFEGVESTATGLDTTLEEAREARKICEANGLKIHSVMRSLSFNSPDFGEAALKAHRHGLQIAAAYGAATALCVPGRVDAPPVSPKDLQIEFDPETLELKSIGADSDADQAYIKAQNEATRAVQKHMPEVLKVAAYEGIRICLENVWNNLWLSPEFYAAFIHSFDSPWLGSYFDLGNHVKYSRTENWLRALGKGTIFKLHLKDFLYQPDEGALGRFVPVGKGTNDWKLIRDVLEEIEYNGFVTIEFEEGESRQLSLAAHARKFRNFFNGEDILAGIEEN